MRLFLLVCIFSCLSGALVAQTNEATTAPEPYTNIERMPLFKSVNCPTGWDNKACADKEMLIYVYGNLKYPKKARRQGIHGMVVISFIVEKDGTVSNASIYRDIGGGAGEEALRVVESMNENGPAWLPGEVDGEPVRVAYKLPVKFKLAKRVPIR